MTKDLKPAEARQGRRGTPVLVVLIVGLLLAVLVWFGLGLYGEAIDPASENQIGGEPTEQSGEESPTQTAPDSTPAPQ